MLAWVRDIDRLIRGDLTRQRDLAQGQLNLPLRALITGAILLGASYGFFMGWFRAFGDQDQGRYYQAVSSMIKVPVLFALTLLVTMPSLYVFNALLGCRLSFASTLRLLMAAISVSLAVAASFGPILAFFTVSTTSYPFIVILNVGLLGIAGIIGLWFLLQTLQKLANASADAIVRGDDESSLPPPESSYAPPRERQLNNPIGVFYFWIVIFGIVGAQMGWLLRPFIGHPRAVFQIFRDRNGSFASGFLQNLEQLLK